MASSSVATTKALLRGRIGRFLPSIRVPEEARPKNWNFVHQGFDLTLVDPDNAKLRQQCKDYMLNDFYREAPVTVALKLADPLSPKEVKDFLHLEMDTFLESGVCICMQRQGASDEDPLVGVGLCAVWPRDEEYDIIDNVSVTDWLNAASQLAIEREEAEGVDRRITYRDLQYQHIYNLSQKTLVKYPHKMGVLWTAMLGIKPEARRSNFSEVSVKMLVDVKEKSGFGIILGTQSNFPPYDKVLFSYYKRPIIVEQAKYDEVDMEIDGEKVLHALKHLGAMKFFIDAPRESSSKL